ncbi:DUF3180 domain-containing protein [Dactylosporangium sp. CA-233914]|uniref:DUF3180 domain-containing protein n=1 Tax=Dactylosporangium sp. CA-233914 TaxID=3239934 RepID=UPI003D8D4C4A
MATPSPEDRNVNGAKRPDGPKNRMEPTSPATLVVAALATTALAWIAISNFWNSLPTLPWLPPLTMIGLAIFEGIEAYSTRNRILRKEGAGPLQPLVIARYAVLGKASALVAALFGGMYVGLSSWLLTQRGVLAKVSENLPQALLGVAGSIVLIAAALWLERSCRVPPNGRDKDLPRQNRPDGADRAPDDQVA